MKGFLKKYGIFIFIIINLCIMAFAVVQLISSMKAEKADRKSGLVGDAYALYLEEDNSLVFTRAYERPQEGELYNNKVITAVYSDFEDGQYLSSGGEYDESGTSGGNVPPWVSGLDYDEEKRYITVKRVIFKEVIRPVSTDSWFSNFGYCTSMDLEKLDTSFVTSMRNMFNNCKSLTKLDLSILDTSSVQNIAYMFSGCSNLIDLNLSNFNTSNVSSMEGMFINCKSLKSLDLSHFNTKLVTDMGSMFSGCSKLKKLNVSKFETENVKYTRRMFNNCSSLKELNIKNFNTRNVIDMREMFKNCSSLTSLDLSKFTICNTDYGRSGMFIGCSSNLEIIRK